MFNFYYNGDFKEFKAKRVNVGETKNGNAYTRFLISTKNKDGSYENVTVFVFKALNIQDGDTVKITRINSFESVIREYNGQNNLQTTIFAEVETVLSAQEAFSPSIMGELPEMNEEGLPF